MGPLEAECAGRATGAGAGPGAQRMRVRGRGSSFGAGGCIRDAGRLPGGWGQAPFRKALHLRLGELNDAGVRLEVFERIAAEATSRERKAARALLTFVRDERAKRAAEIDRELQCWHSEALPGGCAACWRDGGPFRQVITARPMPRAR